MLSKFNIQNILTLLVISQIFSMVSCQISTSPICIFACIIGYHCQNGECVPDKVTQACQPPASRIKCTQPRPTLKECPQLTFIRQPDNIVCGVDASGNKTNYPVECYACRDTKNIFYFNRPCDKIDEVKCSKGYECKDGKCVLIDKCALIRCRNGFRCIKGICIPRLN